MIRKTIHVPIYNRMVVVYIGDSILDTTKAVEKDYSVNMEVCEFTTGYMEVITHKAKKKEHILIVINKDSENRTVAHECLHAAYYILEDVGQDCPQNNHEVRLHFQNAPNPKLSVLPACR